MRILLCSTWLVFIGHFKLLPQLDLVISMDIRYLGISFHPYGWFLGLPTIPTRLVTSRKSCHLLTKIMKSSSKN